MRAGMNQASTTAGSLGFGEGNGEIVAVKSRVHQFHKASGEAAGNPFVCIAVEIQRLDSKLAPTSDDPATEYLNLGGVIWEDGAATDRCRVHPGKASGPDDEEPEDVLDGADEDLSDHVGAEGNAIWVDDYKLFRNSEAVIFCERLESLGFKPELLNGYLDHLVGLKAHFGRHMPAKEAAKTEGRKRDQIVPDKIFEFPYERKAGGGKAAASGAASKTSTKTQTAPPSNGKVSGKTQAAAETEPDTDTVATTMRLLGEIGAKNAGNSLPVEKIAARIVMLFPAHMSVVDKSKTEAVPKPMHGAIQGLIRDAEWLGEAADNLGWTISDGVVAFPTA